MKIEAPKGRTAVAVSGGADSVALLRLLLDAGADVVVLYCNFHLRGDGYSFGRSIAQPSRVRIVEEKLTPTLTMGRP